MSVTTRGRERRERLLRATAELVAARGYHSVGIVDIGAAAGVTGAAIYRHFRTKDDLLVAVIEQFVADLEDGAAGAHSIADLVAAHVDVAMRDRAVIAVYDQNTHNLPADDRRRIRRQQRVYVERWVDALRAERPDLPVDVARARVQATFGLLNSVSDFPSPLPADEQAAVLRSMALAALLSP
jgi:AcrR family transcriptional regulator